MSFLLYQRQRSLGVLLHCGPVCCPFSGVHGYPAYLHLILIYSSHCDDIRAIPYVWVSKSSLFIYLFCMRSDDSDVIFLAIIIAGFKMPLKVKVDVGGILAHLSFSSFRRPVFCLRSYLSHLPHIFSSTSLPNGFLVSSPITEQGYGCPLLRVVQPLSPFSCGLSAGETWSSPDNVIPRDACLLVDLHMVSRQPATLNWHPIYKEIAAN